MVELKRKVRNATQLSEVPQYSSREIQGLDKEFLIRLYPNDFSKVFQFPLQQGEQNLKASVLCQQQGNIPGPRPQKGPKFPHDRQNIDDLVVIESAPNMNQCYGLGEHSDLLVWSNYPITREIELTGAAQMIIKVFSELLA